MARFRLSILRHWSIYNPGEQPVVDEAQARAAKAAGAADVVEELPDEPIHGHPAGAVVAVDAEDIGTPIEVPPLPITEGIKGEPLGGKVPPTPATQADVDATLGANRAHKPNSRRNRRVAEETVPAGVAVVAVDHNADPAVDPVLGSDDADVTGDVAGDVDPFAGAEG